MVVEAAGFTNPGPVTWGVKAMPGSAPQQAWRTEHLFLRAVHCLRKSRSRLLLSGGDWAPSTWTPGHEVDPAALHVPGCPPESRFDFLNALRMQQRTARHGDGRAHTHRAVQWREHTCRRSCRRRRLHTYRAAWCACMCVCVCVCARART